MFPHCDDSTRIKLDFVKVDDKLIKINSEVTVCFFFV